MYFSMHHIEKKNKLKKIFWKLRKNVKGGQPLSLWRLYVVRFSYPLNMLTKIHENFLKKFFGLAIVESFCQNSVNDWLIWTHSCETYASKWIEFSPHIYPYISLGLNKKYIWNWGATTWHQKRRIWLVSRRSPTSGLVPLLLSYEYVQLFAGHPV